MHSSPRVHFATLYLLLISFPVEVSVTRSLIAFGGAGPSQDVIGGLSRKDCPELVCMLGLDCKVLVCVLPAWG